MIRIIRIFDLLQHYNEKYSDLPTALTGKINGSWKSYSSRQYIDTANALSKGLLAMGISKGDKIALIINNCPEWNFFDMAIMQTGAIPVPIYPTISESNYEYIFKEAEVKYIIVSNGEIYNRIANKLSSVPSLLQVFSIEKTDKIKHWLEIFNLGKLCTFFIAGFFHRKDRQNQTLARNL